ncbi:MAG TPA: glycosyl transferase [Methanothermococcus okinawensis]|uniref:Glycosyl transferase n=1 Tax=Methanothermococcus okinawensis TaxID=155863 RepID=A0A833DQI0_9EURY|nr:glycosyl transferase [Methanothermococcus okinawensis]
MKVVINYKYGIDLHKKNKNKIPEMGGIIPVVIASLILMPFNYILSLVLLLVGSIGVYDDLFKLSPFKKLVLLGLVGGIVGYMLFGFDPFKIVIMAIGVSISSNFTNMLAGFNGLEIGLGIISTFFLGLILLLNGEYTGFKLVMLFITSYIGFFLLNKFPAKVFPGDVGTLPIGAFLATIAIKYNLILEYIIIMTPYIIDALLKYISAGVTKREDHKPTTLREDGKLYVSGGYLSLPRIILKKYPMKEYEIVIFIWGIGVFFGIVALLFGIIIKNKFFNLF